MEFNDPRAHVRIRLTRDSDEPNSLEVNGLELIDSVVAVSLHAAEGEPFPVVSIALKADVEIDTDALVQGSELEAATITDWLETISPGELDGVLANGDMSDTPGDLILEHLHRCATMGE